MNEQKQIENNFTDGYNNIIKIYNLWQKSQSKNKLNEVKEKLNNGYTLIAEMNLTESDNHYLTFVLQSRNDDDVLFEVRSASYTRKDNKKTSPLH